MNERVLIVDDSMTVRMDLAEAFTDAGFDAVPCDSAAAARAAIASAPPRLVVLDVLLPDGDGVELLSELRESPATRETPVILLSSEAEVKDRVRGLRHGATDYVGKPYVRTYLIARASSLLRTPPERGASPRVLVIDDSPTYRAALAEALSAAGYESTLASSGEEGLVRAAELRPDAIIVDGVMPGLDGTSVVRRLRLDAALRSIPCLLLTGSDAPGGEVEALDAGADAYVRKTEDREVVMTRLAALMRSAPESRERVAAASQIGPKRVLAVDDSRTYLEALADQLRHDGYEVVLAHSGLEAIELLSVESVDCILLDLLMPGLSGTDTCRRIKGAPTLRRVPLIMLTALEGQAAMIEGINAGADDYVPKSAEFGVLRARLRAQLRRREFEEENRQVREEMLRMDAEAEAMRRVAEVRRELLEELSKKNAALEFHVDELERLNKELGTFAYSVSHDLRQPLRVVNGFAELLVAEYAEALPDEARDYVEKIRTAATRMNELIDGIMRLSRVSQRPIERRPVALDALAARVLARLADAEPERVVHAKIEPGLEVVADVSLMESVLENLLGNAWKFTAKRPEAHIQVGRVDETSFFVRDDGAGFDAAHAERLFGPFQRLHSASEFAGTGIGLATVQRIVHRHGGRVWAESRPGQGATFFFSLPASAGESEP